MDRLEDVLSGAARWAMIEGDCLPIMAGLGDRTFGAVVTDPPYGIGEARGKNKSRGKLAKARDYGVASWDDQPASADQLAAMQRVAAACIVFGGNFFALPPSSCWLVWDKLNGGCDFADCELAWTNLRGAVRRLQHRSAGMLRDDRDRRIHPTQKPVAVMLWCLSFLPEGCTVLDPFAGSATTGVACLRTGRRFVGIEREPYYAAAARERLERADQGGPLFTQQKTLLDFVPEIV